MSERRIFLLPDQLAVCRLPADASPPEWVRGRFTSITRTAQELSIVCDDSAVPEDSRAERGWRAFMVEGPIPFEMTGVAAGLLTPLAEAQVSVFVISTFDTDYLLVKEAAIESASAALRHAGHEVSAGTITGESSDENDFL